MMEPCCYRFTAAEGGARLAATAAAGNTLVTECGAFIATRLLHEEAYHIRGLLSSGRQRSVRIGRAANVQPDAYELSILTDLKVTQAVSFDDVPDWSEELETKEVVVCTSEVFRQILERGFLEMCQINVLVIDSCHMIYKDEHLQYIMGVYKQSDETQRPRILAISYPIFNSNRNTVEVTEESNALAVIGKDSDGSLNADNLHEPVIKQSIKELGVQENLDDFDMYEKLEYKIDHLEDMLCCRMDLAEDIDGCKRISGPTTKPKEVLIEYVEGPSCGKVAAEYAPLEQYMRHSVHEVMEFLEDHRHDPTEIYGEDLYEEFKSIPDPIIEPMQIFKEFLYILEQLGPYGADKAAFSLLIKLEKLKIKVPYERHFLLLRLCTTTFVKIRCHAELVFSKYDSDWDKIRLFSTSKLLRLVEILEQFTPADLRSSIENNTYVKIDRRHDSDHDSNVDKNVSHVVKPSFKEQMMADIEKCAFSSLGDRIADRLHTIEANLKDLDIGGADEKPVVATENGQSASLKPQTVPESGSQPAAFRRSGRGVRRRAARAPRAAQSCLADALCGLLYVTEPLMAKILFMLIVDISRARPAVSYINCQYCVVEPTGEHKETQRQGRRHEEVLKKFRMHECNLLLTTSALEEGIDLPRCNLVLRWDVPPSYRSYVLSRSRSRAARSGAALLGAARHTDTLLHHLATYRELDHIITRKCGCGVQDEPPSDEESHADTFNTTVKPYTPADAVKPCHCDKLTDKDVAMKRTISDSENDHRLENNTNNIGIHQTAENLNHDRNIVDDKNNDALEDGNNVGRDQKIPINDNQSFVNGTINDQNDISGVNSDCTAIISNVFDQIVDKTDQSVISRSDNDVSDNKSVYVLSSDENKEIGDKISENDAKNSDVNSVKCSCNRSKGDNVASVDLNSAIALINRYCAKLPSDTFTRLAPQWWMERVRLPGSTRDSYICTVRLPLNCPVKYNIVGHPMPTRVLARRMVALQACRVLHASGELDHQLMPIGKETFKAMEMGGPQPAPDPLLSENDARPGTTKRRQYYYKRTAWAFTNCEPVVDTSDTELENRTVDPSIPEPMDHLNEIKDLKTNLATDSVEVDSAILLESSKLESVHSDSTILEPIHCDSTIPEPIHCDSTIHSDSTILEPIHCDSTIPEPIHCDSTIHSDSRILEPIHCDSTIPESIHCDSTIHSDSTILEPIHCDSTIPEPIHCDSTILKSIHSDSTIPESVHSDSTIPESVHSRLVQSDTPKSDVNSDAKLDNDIKLPETMEKTAEFVENYKNTGTRRNMLYAIECSLWCALPERYNTRGRRLHAPQNASQALAILMAREEPTNLQIPSFPVYTRSGEVRVSVEHVPDADVRVSPRRGRLVRRFMRFVFTEVLRVRRRGMSLHAAAMSRNNYYIVPTIKTFREDGTKKIDIDWGFLEQIYKHTEEQKLSPEKPPLWQLDEEEMMCERERTTTEKHASAPLKNPLLKEGEVFVFDPELYREAVVTPWYRNQDQPQFFLVAEICTNLTPDSAFPSPTHESFRTYYRAKYKVELTQPNQPLLDVDHTSARLNLLTPRYVNRKGVALPVSSERTRRAKRDRLDQKQILVPELCTVHPFAAPLWFATVALPCVLYRINALLIADEIRRAVAIDVGLGIPKVDETTMPGFHWPPLDFGWCLAEVLNADADKIERNSDDGSDKDEPALRAIEETAGQDAEEAEEGVEEKKKTINELLQEEHEKLNQEDTESGFEIGTWSNDMASSIPDGDDIYDEWSETLPHNLTFCTAANGGVNWCEPVQKPKSDYNRTRAYTMADSDCSYMSSDFDSDDSDFETDGTDTDAESGFGSSKVVNASLGVRIEYKSAHEAEAVDVEITKKVHPAPQRDPQDEKVDRAELMELLTTGDADPQCIEKFRAAVESHKATIVNNGLLVKEDQKVCDLLPATKDKVEAATPATDSKLNELFPYENLGIVDGQISLQSIENNKRRLLSDLKNSLSEDEIVKLHCFYMKDVDIDDPDYINEKIANVGFDSKDKYVEMVHNYRKKEYKPYYEDKGQGGQGFDFDHQPDLDGHPGPSPSVILQALTMSNANDGINLERLETIGDSFLKFAITAYLYCAQPAVHEGKLSHMRSKQVSNLNLYRLGRSARLGARMIASKFEPHDNWLPPCHRAPPDPHLPRTTEQDPARKPQEPGCYIPYNLITQHSIPDKSIADCVEALIGAYLLECGPRGALLFMSWLGISVLPHHKVPLKQTREDAQKSAPSSKRVRTVSSSDSSSEAEDPLEGDPWSGDWGGPPGARRPYRDENGDWYQIVYGSLKAPPSPLLRYVRDPDGELERMLSGYDALEETLQYRFKDRSLLLQALTHASHQRNTLTDCYQRLEFLGDAILDYLITRHLYEDGRRHSPGALTDLRSALVNNTIFATLCVRHGFHKYFRHMSPGLNEVLLKYVKIQEENGHSISEEHYLIQEDELEQAEDVEVPKALGDLFESIAGAIFLDSGMSLGAVWESYVRLMGAELEAFSAHAPKSPVRELLEAEPDTAKFSKPERLADGRRVRVCVEVFGRGTFKGIGRNYRIAKGTAARCALRHLRKHRPRR